MIFFFLFYHKCLKEIELDAFSNCSFDQLLFPNNCIISLQGNTKIKFYDPNETNSQPNTQQANQSLIENNTCTFTYTGEKNDLSKAFHLQNM